MKFYHLGFLLLLTSCATKYLIPGSRFITPETQGDAFRGQLEFQVNQATNVTIDTSNGTVDDGVNYEKLSRAGFLVSNSVFNQLDLVWSHTGGSASLLGAKFQVIGDPRISRSSGHKASLAALFGGNEHELEDESIEFELTGSEYIALYGYRINEHFMPYLSFSFATYTFNGKINATGALQGLEPQYITDSRALNSGLEISLNEFFLKAEGTYQKLKTDHTKDKDVFLVGYSLGFSW